MRELAFSDLCTFTDKQLEATQTADGHTYTLYGGSRGPGKSFWLRWYAIRRLLIWASRGLQRVRVGLFCEDYPSLKDRQISKLAQLPLWLGELRETKTDGLGWYLRDGYGGGGILLRNLDDPTKYQSVEFAGIAIDELTKNPASVFDTLRGSLRWPGVADPFFIAATNPNGRHARWVRSYWIEGDLPDYLERARERFAYVQALPADNPHLDESYWEMLNTLPLALQQAWRDGDWYVSVEGLVYATFDDGNVTGQDVDPEQPFEIAIDDGYIDPRAVLFVQKQGAHALIFDELYKSKQLEEDTIADILRTCYRHSGVEQPWPEDAATNEERVKALRGLGVRLPDLAAVSHEAVALRRRLREADIPARNWLAHKVSGRGSTRAAAIRRTRELILDGQGHRTILVHKRCKNLLDEILTGYRNKEGGDGFLDEPADGNDHACQALESWVWLRAGREL